MVIVGPYAKRESRRRILSALEEAPGTFEELLERTGLSRSVFSLHLKELENDGLIEREYQRVEKGRGRLLVKLSLQAEEPIRKTLRALEHLAYPPWNLDLELGRRLLTKPVVDAIVDIVHDCFKPMGIPPSQQKPEFNKLTLIRGLAIYDSERFLSKQLENIPREEKESPHFEAFYLVREFRKRKPDALVALPIVKERNFIEKFDKLIEWIKSLRSACDEGLYFSSQSLDHHSLLWRWAENQASRAKKGPSKGGGEKPR